MKILIADDHPLVIAGLRGQVALLDAAAETLVARSLWEVCELISVHPDLALVLLDFRMPGMEGVASVRRVVDLVPTAPVVVVSAHHGATFPADLAAAGAAGLIPKNVSEPVVVAALRQVLAGQRYFPAALFAMKVAAEEDAAPGDELPLATRLATLTPREREVLDHLATGLSNKGIARLVGCSDATVKVHVKAILKKLDAPSRAVVAAMVKAV
ncbi:MAG: response regulator transcription factor [Alphaproteobacteria bacterium]|jgi:DNA-binding NarL/FixJ family response regulator|nr:response regulator transcription factor [Alphaproteobacteria bacterium]